MSSFSLAAPSPNSPAAIRLAALVVIGWLVATAHLLWDFEQQRLARVQQLVHFSVDDLPPPPLASPAGAAKVLYFLDRGCSCHGAAVAEIARLQRAMLLPDARFAFDAAGAADAGEGVRALTVAEQADWRGRIPAAPAAALWNDRGKLIYFGPISAAAGCGDRASYLHNALRTMRKDSDAAFASWDVATCACPTAQAIHS